MELCTPDKLCTQARNCVALRSMQCTGTDAPGLQRRAQISHLAQHKSIFHACIAA